MELTRGWLERPKRGEPGAILYRQKKQAAKVKRKNEERAAQKKQAAKSVDRTAEFLKEQKEKERAALQEREEERAARRRQTSERERADEAALGEVHEKELQEVRGYMEPHTSVC